MLKSALIGCGKIGSKLADDPRAIGIQSHAEAFRICGATQLIAVCDSSQEAADECASRWDVKSSYTDVSTLLKESNPEIVSICTPDTTHAEILRKVIIYPSVRGILMEKPITLDVESAQSLVQEARSRGVILSVNYTRRFSKSFQELKKWLDMGGLGTIRSINGHYVKGLIHNGTHWFDLSRWWLGEVARLRAKPSFPECGSDPTLDVELEFVNGARGFLQGHDTRDFTLFEMDLLGTKGRLRILEGGEKFEAFQVRESPYTTGNFELLPLELPFPPGTRDAIVLAVEDLVDCIRQKGKSERVPKCSGKDGVKALELAVLARSSAQASCAWVSPPGEN